MSIQVRSNSPQNDAAAMKASQLAGAGQAAQVEKETDASDPAAAAGEVQKEEQEEVEASESDPEAAEANDETGEAEESEQEEQSSETQDDQAAAGKDEQSTKPKKKGGFQKRIEKLNARNQAELTARLAAERERDYYRDLAAKAAGGEKQKTEKTPIVDVPGKPRADAFASNEEFVEAMADWKADQKLKARDLDQAKKSLETEHQAVIVEHAKRINAFKAKTPNFDEVIADADSVVSMTPAMEQMIVTSELGPEVLYHLCKNPSEANRIAKLRPLDAAKEMGKIELRFAPKASGGKEPETKIKVTKAPRPLESLSSGARGASPRTLDKAQTQAEYEAIRREQMKARQASR